MTVAIDFGTSNTVLARWNAATQQPETLSLNALSQQLGDNPPLIPSLVYVKNAQIPDIIVGQTVRDRGLDLAQDRRFFRNFKRGIGTDIQGFLPDLDGQMLSFEQIGQWFIEQVWQQLAAHREQPEALTFTVPVDSFEAYRNWLGQVCQSLDIQQVRMLDEPTAAALGYGLEGGETLLVIDFGGGTLDLSLVQLAAPASGKPLGFLLKWGQQSLAQKSGQQVKTARVLAKAGEALGGADIDHWLADYFEQTQAIAPSPLTLRLAERLKIKLSSQKQATEVYFNDETLESYELSLERSQLEKILRENQFFQRLDSKLEQVLQQAQRQEIDLAQIEAVLLVGGTAQMPAVRDWIHRHFAPEKVRSDRPFEAIAHGALQLQQGVEVKDFLYHSYGIRYWDRRQNCHNWHPIIQQGQPYPMEKPVELLLGASTENQPSLELILGELGDEETRTEVYFEGDRLVTRQIRSGSTQVQPLNDREGARTIATLDPPGFPGSDRVRVYFRIDADRFLRITVEDILTNRFLLSDQAVVQLS
ncbi:Hsp70 family protein [Almyronema epifaneia]|uniref:Hsp70 family protein n=1 Tax=Almyronema epifaneia S1 TaxID=2991925 RepID=A0ABW6IDN3_9CYAN